MGPKNFNPMRHYIISLALLAYTWDYNCKTVLRSIITPRYNLRQQEKLSLKPDQGCNQKSRQNIEAGEGKMESYCTAQCTVGEFGP